MAITRVQAANATTGATASTTLAVTITAPDLTDGKYHYIMGASTSSGLCPIVPDAGYTWQMYSTVATNTTVINLYFGRIFSGAGTTITVTNANSANIAAILAEYKSDNPLRLDRGMVSTGSSTSPSTGTTSTTSNANELCIAGLAHRLANSATTGTFTAPTNSYTEILAGGKSTNVNTAGNDREVDLLEKFLTSTGTTTAGATVTTGSNWAGAVWTFEEVAVSGSSGGSYTFGG